MFLDDLVNCFFENFVSISIFENDKLFEFRLTSKFRSNFSINTDKIDFSFIQPNDNFSMVVTYGENDPIQFFKSTDELDDFVTNLNDVSKYIDDNTVIHSSITINKKNDETGITIYDLDVFQKTLSFLSISQVFSIFDRAFSASERLIFNVLNLEGSICSETIFFIKAGTTFNSNVPFGRKKNKRSNKNIVSLFKNRGAQINSK